MTHNNHSSILLTREGLAELQKEHKDLIETKRPNLIARIKNAREQGDLSENSDYEAAREELAFTEGRIAELEQVLHDAKLISLSKKTKGAVDVGSTVTVHINGKKEAFMVVGEWEANPTEKKISHSSPLGKALMGKKVGQEVEVEAPAGKVKYKVLGIE